MDAMVFFAFATIASSMLVLSASENASDAADLHGNVDMNALLESFLASSTFEELVVHGDITYVIPADTSISDMIILLTSLQEETYPYESSSEMRDLLQGALESLEPPSSELFLVIQSEELGHQCLAIPRVPPSVAMQYAASAAIPAFDGSLMIVSLVLQPSALPELLDVCIGYADLGLRVSLPF